MKFTFIEYRVVVVEVGRSLLHALCFISNEFKMHIYLGSSMPPELSEGAYMPIFAAILHGTFRIGPVVFNVILFGIFLLYALVPEFCNPGFTLSSYIAII